MHHTSKEAETERVRSERTGGVSSSVKTKVVMHRSALRGESQVLYHLAKQEIPNTTNNLQLNAKQITCHTTNHLPLLELAEILGLEYV